MRLLICGQRAFGAMVYRAAVEEGHDVAMVVAPAMRRDGELPDRLRKAAQDDGVPWLESGHLKADRVPEGTDLIVAAHSHDFISAKTRARSVLGAVGYHPSLLPRHRGRDAVRWTLHMGDAVTGGTVYWLGETMDGGDVAAQRHVFVEPRETMDTLWRDKLAPLGVSLFRQVWADLAAGRIVRWPQDPACVTWEPSWERPPVHRPELEMIGALPEGYEVVRD